MTTTPPRILCLDYPKAVAYLKAEAAAGRGRGRRRTSLDSPTSLTQPERANPAPAAAPHVLRYRQHLAKVARQIVLLRDPKGQLRALPSKFTSRYTPEGRARLGEKLRKRIPNDRVPGVFLTLTVDPAQDLEPIAATRRLGQRWNRLMTALRKRTGQKLQYVRVLEFTRKGWPHLHVWFPGAAWLAPQKWLAQQWGAHVWIVKASARAAKYVVKYLRKLNSDPESSGATLLSSKARLYSWSRNFAAAVEDAEPGWELIGVALLPPGVEFANFATLPDWLAPKRPRSPDPPEGGLELAPCEQSNPLAITWSLPAADATLPCLSRAVDLNPREQLAWWRAVAAADRFPR